MPFVKIDTNILNSTLWYERICRELFLTALFMAEPRELDETPQIDVATGKKTNWVVPTGWYGFVESAGIGIVKRALIDNEAEAMKALARLGEPESGGRTTDYEGRRLVRVEGGFVVLNYFKYRDRDYTAASRSKLYRDRKRHGVSPLRDGVTGRNVTQADAEAQADADAEIIYHAYPRKVGKPVAIKSIKKAIAKTGPRVLLERTELYARSVSGIEARFIPYPATWYNQERFNDDPSTWCARSNGSTSTAAQRKLDRSGGLYPSNVDHNQIIQ